MSQFSIHRTVLYFGFWYSYQFLFCCVQAVASTTDRFDVVLHGFLVVGVFGVLCNAVHCLKDHVSRRSFSYTEAGGSCRAPSCFCEVSAGLLCSVENWGALRIAAVLGSLCFVFVSDVIAHCNCGECIISFIVVACDEPCWFVLA